MTLSLDWVASRRRQWPVVNHQVVRYRVQASHVSMVSVIKSTSIFFASNA
nr:hypothetical protein [Alteromonas macleodii]